MFKLSCSFSFPRVLSNMLFLFVPFWYFIVSFWVALFTCIYKANQVGILVPKWRRITVDATSSRRIDLNTTSFCFYVMCPLGTNLCIVNSIFKTLKGSFVVFGLLVFILDHTVALL